MLNDDNGYKEDIFVIEGIVKMHCAPKSRQYKQYKIG
jgi:hypothetical protein